MDGQDEMDDILVESYPDNIKRTFGGIAMNGCMKMNETYGSGGDEMTDTWTIFGDPSVMVRTALPEPISATHDNQIFLGATTFTVNSSVEGALVALSRDNQFITSAYVNGGVATLTFPAFQMPDSVELVITAYNFIPYQTSIAVLPNDGPYLIYNHTSINDAPFNNNGQADFGETVGLNVEFANIGVMAAENVTITVTSADDYISVTDSLETYSALPAQDTTGVLDGFSMSIAENVPDNHIAVLHFTATDGNDTWSGNFSITLHAGIMHYLSYTIDDTQYGNGNHKAEPGETFDMLVTVKNTGSAPVTGIGGQISFNDQYVSNQSSPWQNFGDIEALSLSEKPYTLYADPSTPEGHVITVIMHIDGDLGLQTTESFNLVIGQIPVAVIDLDGNKNSGTEIRNALNANSVYAEYKTSMPGDISGYTALFVCLGVDNKRHVLSTAEGQKLANFVDAGGRLYMEGGDTWYRDPKTAVHPKFKTNGVMDGSSDLNSESGQTGQFAEGLEFTYDGDNVFIDHISANAPAFNLFKNTTPLYITSVGYDAGTYRTIASSFEFGGLADGQFPSTKDEYMHRIIEFFGILASPYTANFMGNPINICEGESVSFVDYSTTGTTTWQWMFPGGNPASSTEQNPVINYPVTGLYDVTLITGNGTLTDTLVKKNYVWAANCTGLNNRGENTLSLYPNPASNYVTINFPVKNEIANLQIFDNQGKQILTRNSIKTDTPLVLNISALTDGIYQVKIEIGNRIQTLKLAIKH
jgi:PKD repeat protein